MIRWLNEDERTTAIDAADKYLFNKNNNKIVGFYSFVVVLFFILGFILGMFFSHLLNLA